MLFSIVVPMYNVEAYAEECINSILNQSSDDFELILVDDGSTDRTSSIIEAYKKNDPRVKAVHKQNGGLVSARKAGTQIALGEYVVPVDGDDWVGKDFLKTFANTIAEHPSDLVICWYTKSDGTIEKKCRTTTQTIEPGYYGPDEKEMINQQLFSFLPVIWAKAYKREQYKKIQMQVPDVIGMGEDSCVTYPFICNADRISIIDSTEYFYRSNPNSMTKSKKKIVSWECTLAKIRFLSNHLNMTPDITDGLNALAVHAAYTTISTNLNNRPYNDVKREANKVLDTGYADQYFNKTLKVEYREEKLAFMLIKHRMYWLIKIIEKFR